MRSRWPRVIGALGLVTLLVLVTGCGPKVDKSQVTCENFAAVIDGKNLLVARYTIPVRNPDKEDEATVKVSHVELEVYDPPAFDGVPLFEQLSKTRVMSKPLQYFGRGKDHKIPAGETIKLTHDVPQQVADRPGLRPVPVAHQVRILWPAPKGDDTYKYSETLTAPCPG